jgi:DNA polymerase-1
LTHALRAFSDQSIRMEHKVAQLIKQQEDHGFYLDLKKASLLLAELTDQEAILHASILKDFHPKPKLLQEVTPKVTKKGDLSRVGLKGFDPSDVGGSFSHIVFETFNLGSPSQIVERLNAAGWSPIERTDGYKKLLERRKKKEITEEEFTEAASKTWKVSEINLATIHETAPESAKNLARWKMISSRKTLVETWIDLADERSRVHGRINTLGTWTHRASHYEPNMGNVPGVNHGSDGSALMGVQGAYGFECRDVWGTEPGRVLLGVDAKGIQLRALAHYVRNQEYVDTVISGDPHAFHAGILSSIVDREIPRDVSKTFIYAYLLGAGVDKVSAILGVNKGSKVKKEFPKHLPGLEDLMEELDRVADRGYMRALDGRLITIPSRHKALACYLQSFETVIMRRAMCSYHKAVKEEGLDAHQVAWVHDEFQIDTTPKDVVRVGELVINSIVEAGLAYETFCPMDGDMKYGQSWSYTH